MDFEEETVIKTEVVEEDVEEGDISGSLEVKEEPAEFTFIYVQRSPGDDGDDEMEVPAVRSTRSSCHLSPSVAPRKEEEPEVKKRRGNYHQKEEETGPLFISKMDTKVRLVIREALALQKNPRAFQRFYHTVHSSIEEGIKKGFIGSLVEVDQLWVKYDELASTEFENGSGKLEPQEAEELIKNRSWGKRRRGRNIKKSLQYRNSRRNAARPGFTKNKELWRYALEQIKGCEERGTTVQDDLEVRRQFFEKLKFFCLKQETFLNEMWTAFFNLKSEEIQEFIKAKGVSVTVTPKCQDEVKIEVKESPPVSPQAPVEEPVKVAVRKDVSRRRSTSKPKVLKGLQQKLPQKKKKEKLPKLKQDPEETAFQKSMNRFLWNAARKSKMSPEELEELRNKEVWSRRMRRAAMTKEQKKREVAQNRKWRHGLSKDKKKKYRESVYKSIKRSFEKQKETNPEKFKERYEKVMSYNRERTANETPEQRQKRLLRYKVNQAKRRAKNQMEKEGLPQEEIERRLEEVRREVEQRESSKPNKEYVPRVGARKSKMLIKLEEQVHQPSTVSVDDINSSVVQVLPPPPPQLDQPPPDSFIHPDLDYPQFLPSPMAQDDDDNYDDCDYQPPNYEPNVPESSSENIPELDLSSPLKVEVEEAPLPSSSTTPSKSQPQSETKTAEMHHIICEDCGKSVRYGRMAAHRRNFHSAVYSKFCCPKCEVECKTATSLWKHYVNFHGEAEAPIPTTKVKPSSSKSVGVRDKQAVRDRGGPVTCDQCGKQYKQRATLDDHIRRVHLSQRFFCDVCSKEEQTATKLWRHKKDKHGTDEPPPAEMVVCDYCGEQVLRSYGHHVQRRHPEKYDEYLESIGALRNPSSNNFSIATVTVKCSECQREILHSSLKRHMRSVHKRDSRKFQCQQCGQEFTEMYGLKDHTGNLHTINFIKKKMEAKNLIKMQMESGRRIFYCSLCDAKFTSKVDVGGHFLAQHFDIYEQLKKPAEGQNWKCEECSKEFLSDALFSSHLRVEHPSKMFYCGASSCLKLFSDVGSLKQHHCPESDADRFNSIPKKSKAKTKLSDKPEKKACPVVVSKKKRGGSTRYLKSEKKHVTNSKLAGYEDVKLNQQVKIIVIKLSEEEMMGNATRI